jgi:hypothetical protein
LPDVPRGRGISKPNIIEVPADVMEEERKTSVENMGPIPDLSFQGKTSFKMPDKNARMTALLARATYNRQTLNNLPQEAKYAEIVIAEIKKFICMMYGTIVRFYIPVLKYNDLHEMREDMIELLTSLTVKGELSKLILQLCRLGTKEDEQTLSQKFQELATIKPERVGIDRLFTLNDSSKLLDMFARQEEQRQLIEGLMQISGDVGGSTNLAGFDESPDPKQTVQTQKRSSLVDNLD